MKLRFLGATGTVTGSKYLVSTPGARLLVDCGLFQGYKQLRLHNWAPPPFHPASIDSVVLTHAHIDHSGYLPLLVRNGFRGKVHCTAATRDLCRIMLPDSAHLQEEQAKHANRYGYSRHSPALPLYTREDAQRALELMVPHPFAKPFSPVPGIEAAFSHAGHILGAASLRLVTRHESILFSGDLGRGDDPLMRPAQAPPDSDVVVMESTYGGRRHPEADAAAQLAAVVSRTAARGGVTIVPAFAVGRAQLLLHLIARARAAGAIPQALRIYLDSPMACDVTDLFARYAGEHRLSGEEARAMAQVARFVRDPAESMALDESPLPMVIVAGSGMATGGRVLHHLKRFAPDPRNCVVLAGFQAGGTRGADLARGVREIRIHGGWVPVRAHVEQLEGLSAHADADGLLEWLARLTRPPARLFLTHGEPEQSEALRRAIAQRFGWSAEVPELLDEADFPA